MKIAVALLVLAILDYGFQRWKYEQDLRMTPQEVREEMKNLEGNPQVHRPAPPGAAATGPEPALRRPCPRPTWWSPTRPSWPWPSSTSRRRWPRRSWWPRGPGWLPSGSASWPWSNGIPIVEKKPLAQALYREVEVNHPIPQDKYAAVAEVLAYVYQLKGKKIPSPRAG